MPDPTEPTQTPAPGGADVVAGAGATRRPVAGVLFDFHGTLAQVEDPRAWVTAAAAACGVEVERARATALADRLLTAGRAGGPLPARVPPRLAELWADRDLYPHAHRGAYTGLAETVDAGIDGFAEALYDRLLVPEGWVPYPDTAPTLAALREAGVRVAVVSNIGFDIRPLFAAWGLADLVDAFVLSYEVGRCKPDPGIFLRACAMIGVEPERTLMVGDTPADAGAVAAGCAVLVLPAADAGVANGLGGALDLAGVKER
ncbi:HAD family hydrolase [Micromonospora endolithica]|uniref:HAD family hydrolase n=1 Tax=Micromonospora endolithica TaxID=230091 RepID=A0A3A9Z2D2_9ACTN|nr:HAD-IA family hydrolase [Micromonospora endolithica]RKN41566.1 HAD family hydrolase [Micromonospora endolithica]TWJ21953.1 HAD superfamily hydrolase (TIGR01509 family)/HAD superfamily hydrolase (TIGR01549 family) [Micromonospora endolithica]